MFRGLLGSLACSIVIVAFAGPAFAANPVYSVSAIRAYLYYDDTGEIGTVDITRVADGDLFNTIIGEGLAGRPSNTTLIIVEVYGPSFASKDVGKLFIKATADQDQGEGSKQTVVLERSVDLNNYFQEHHRKILVPVFLYQTGSIPVTVTATLKGGNEAKGMTAVLKRTINFTGGE